MLNKYAGNMLGDHDMGIKTNKNTKLIDAIVPMIVRSKA